MASTVGRVQDLIVEDREVQGETETDGVGRSELSLSDVGGVLNVDGEHVLQKKKCWGSATEGSGVLGYLVSLVGSVGSLLSLIARGKLGEITVVVTLPISH